MITSFNFFAKGKSKATLQLSEIGKGMSEFSYMLAFEQSKNESLLAQNLVDHGKEVHWNHEFAELIEHEDKIVASVKHNDE